MRTILVVEDSPLLLQMLSTLLRAKGFQVIEAQDAYRALKVTDGRPIDMVITDLIMPGMDGIELTWEIRTLNAYKAIPILMLTTQSQAKARREGSAAGITGWVVKPFHADNLIALIKKFLGAE